MQTKSITVEVARDLGLSTDEFERICQSLGRTPNYTELGLFSAMWSEHCSYKNSKKLLRLLPAKGKNVFIQQGENSGAVLFDDETAIVFKVESHNHPSAVAPYEASATGGGGCVRDIFAVGARPLFLLSSLRFGLLSDERTNFLFREVARGFTDYANKVDLPALAGDIYFDKSYQGNPLVNAMVVGVLKKDDLVRAQAQGVGNLVIIAGGATGRDGVEGANFASAGLDESAQDKTSAVAIGDPRIGKIIREACLELASKKLIVGMQDMGAAGLVCSTAEMAYKAGTGIEIDISFVPRKEEGMTPYEVMLSESQERMLFIVEPNQLDAVKVIMDKWGADFSVIGKVTDDGVLRVKENGTVVAEVPARYLVEAPEYTRETKEPSYLSDIRKFNPQEEVKEPADYNRILLSLLSLPTIASKQWVSQKVDAALTQDACLTPGGETAAYYYKPTNSAIAATVSGNGLYCYLNPFRGGAIAVAEASRRLVCCGAEPLGITDGLNFGNPFNPEIYWQFKNVIMGMIEAAESLSLPIVSGNVSFNNENPRGAIYPTPVIGMVGIVRDAAQVTSGDFKNQGDIVLLIGENKDELNGSLYLHAICGITKGDTPSLDLAQEKKLEAAISDMIRAGIINSARDCTLGGLGVALAKSCIASRVGAVISCNSSLRLDSLLFSENQSKVIVSVSPDNKDAAIALCKKHGVACTDIGKTGGDRLEINNIISLGIKEISDTYEQVIPQAVAR